ncbi:MAG: conjugal transfer protein TraH [Proteobacteria bacterium]|nr:conjugal transfer protein TraH [Pseudomonadota bacterium]
MGNLSFLHIFLPKDRNLGYSKAISLYNILVGKYSSLLHKLAVFVLALSLSITAQADDIGDSMSEFWNDMGGTSNATSGGSYEGQAAGYYSLGNVFARSKIKNKNFVSLQMPSHRAGCGGIDMFAGSFSYINADELISLFNSIASNAGAFAFKLGLETLSPQIAEQVSELQKIVQEMNEFQINSCEQAASLVGGIWPKHDEASKSICTAIGNRRGLFSDAAAAKHGCTAGGRRADTLNSQDGEFENVKVTNINMAWKSIKDSGILGVGSDFDTDLAEIFMTLSGTVIVTAAPDDDSQGEYRVITGKVASNNLLSALLDGGTINVTSCDEPEECLSPSIDTKTVTITSDRAFHEKVKTILEGLAQKIASEANGSSTATLSQEERSLLNMTSIPIYKALNVSAAYSGSAAIFELNAYSEIIATDLLFQYLDLIMKDVQNASNSRKFGNEEDLAKFKETIRDVRRELASKEHKKDRSVDTLLNLINRTTMIEQLLASKLSSNMTDSLQWKSTFK